VDDEAAGMSLVETRVGHAPAQKSDPDAGRALSAREERHPPRLAAVAVRLVAETG
jgi:hypothetical protein